MQKGLSIVELATEIQRISEAKRDFVAPTTKLQMQLVDAGGEKVEAGDFGLGLRPVIHVEGNGAYGIGTVAHDQLAERLGIPRKYYDRMAAEAPALLAANVNTWFKREPERRFVRTLDGNVRAFLSDRYRPLDYDLVAKATLPILAQQPDLKIMSTQITDRRLYLQAVTPRLTADVKVGDTVQAGIVISNSEVGLGAVNIETLIFRLRCLNGMITAAGIKRHHVGKKIGTGEDVTEGFYRAETIEAANRAFILQIQDTVNNHFSEAGFFAEVERLRAAADRRIEAPKINDAVVELANRFTLTKGEMEKVLGNFIEGADLSQWGLANAVTALAHKATDYDRSVEFERIGGKVIDLTPAEFKFLN